MSSIMKISLRDVTYQFWTYAYTTVISFIVFAILARFLEPAEFGLYALGTVIVAILYTFGQGGFVSLSYSEINRSDKVRNTLFWTNILTACCWTVVASGAMYIVVSEPRRRTFMISLVATLLITSISEIANVTLLTAQRFRAIAIKQVLVQTVGATVVLMAAFAGSGAWSLIIQRCISGILEIALVFLLIDWRPRVLFDLSEFRRLLPQALGFAGNSTLVVLESRLADLVIAAFSTLDQVATYRIAARVLDSILSLTCQPISSVTTASVAASSPPDRGTVYRSHAQLLLWIGAVPFAGLLCLGDILIPIVFGTKWTESGLIAQILAIQFFVAGPVWMAEAALTATGRAKELFIVRLIGSVLSITLIVAFSFIGIEYIALSLTIRTIFLFPLYVSTTYFITERSLIQTIREAFSPLLVALSSAGAARGSVDFARYSTLGPISSLAIGIVIGGTVFAILFFRFGYSKVISTLVWKRQ